ncbi:hypothetical protein ABW21_db0201672 [Orbilia brochopaga]|nr:hypothetical protein ABW21_db0201672 [Drechslerella brochopaga]
MSSEHEISGLDLARRVLLENGINLDERVQQSTRYQEFQERKKQQELEAEKRQQAEELFRQNLERIRYEDAASQKIRPIVSDAERVLDHQNRRFILKEEASHQFPPSIQNIQKKITSFESSMLLDHLPTKTCLSCARLAAPVNMQPISIFDPLLNKLRVPGEPEISGVHLCATDGNAGHICRECLTTLQQRRTPRFCKLNGFDLGCSCNIFRGFHRPQYLEGLTDVEEMLIAKYRPVGKVRKIAPKHRRGVSYRHIGGHVIVVPLSTASVYQVLPDARLDWTELVKVVWISVDRPNPQTLAPYLSWVSDVETEAEERAGYAPRDVELDHDGTSAEDPVSLFTGSVVGEVDRSPLDDGARLLHELENLLDDRPSNGAYIEYRYRGIPSDYYSNPEFFTGTFPALFWNGAGSHLAPRKFLVSVRAWVHFLISHHDRRWAEHPTFIFLAFNVLLRKENSLFSHLITQRTDWPEVEKQLHSLRKEDVQKAALELQNTGKVTSSVVRSVMNSISSYGRLIPLSKERRMMMRREAFGMVIKFGAPAIWLTLNPNDLGSPVALKLTGKVINVEIPYRESRLQRTIAITNNPVASATFFHHIVNAFFKAMILPSDSGGDGGIFGETEAYFGATETNGRGALHIHCLIWLKGNCNFGSFSTRLTQDKAFAERMITYLESIIRTDASSLGNISRDILESRFSTDAERFEERLLQEGKRIVYKVNMHDHSATCHKYEKGKTGCRFGAPWKPVDRSYVDSEGTLHLKRRKLDIMVNQWNPAIAVCVRSNHDVDFLPTKAKYLALIHYITNYATKLQKPIYHYYALTADVFPSRSETLSIIPPAKGLVNQILNRIGVVREVSGPEVALSLLNHPERYTNVCDFEKISCYSLLFAMQDRYGIAVVPENPQNQSSGSGKSAKSSCIIIRNKGVAFDQLEDYKFRGNGLRKLCLYDYRAMVQRKHKYKSSRNPGNIPFEEGHAGYHKFVQVFRPLDEVVVPCFIGIPPHINDPDQQNRER